MNSYAKYPWRDVSPAERELLTKWVRARSSPQALVARSQIVLMLADGLSERSVSKTLGVNRRTVTLWRTRFEAGGCEALTREKPGRGRKPTQRRVIES